MKPAVLCILAAGAAAAGVSVALTRPPKQVELPVYDRPVTFFQEGKQALLIGDLPRGIESLSAGACASCHQEEHADWASSSHAGSISEPVFAAAFRAENRFVCRSCHAPLPEQQPHLVHRMEKKPAVLLHGTSFARRGSMAPAHLVEKNPDYDRALAGQGVTCVTCHVRDGTVLTANRTARADVPHALSYAPVLRTSEFCGGCHQFDIHNPSVHPFEPDPLEPDPGQARRLADLRLALRPRRVGLPVKIEPPDPDGETPPVPPQPELEQQYQLEPRVQHTLEEWRISPAAAEGKTCQSCHMPAARETRRHHWPGRRDSEMLRRAVTMTVRLDRETYRIGDRLQAVVRLRNGAGHRFPTGDSIHAGILDVWLKGDGKTLGRQVLVMTDQSGHRQSLVQQAMIVDRHFFVAPGSPRRRETSTLQGLDRADTRLLPGEEATIVYRQPVSAELAAAKELTLRVRVFHAAVNPAFRHTRIDPKIDTLRLIDEQVVPVRTADPARAAASRGAGAVGPG